MKTPKHAKTKKPKKAGPAPTGGIYGALAACYDHFNGELFGGRLPPCLLTLRAKGRIYGYFSPGRFTAGGATMEKVDELAMNPARFSARELRDTLSTVAHEMAHVEHQHFGSPGSGGYHNKEFAKFMARIGLICSDTGKLGGKQTGRQMTHYIVDGGPFDLSCTKLMGQGFTLPWAEPPPPAPPPGLEGWEPPDRLPKRLPGADGAERTLRAVMRAMAKAGAADKLALRHAAEIVAAIGHSPAAWSPDHQPEPGSKLRFTCPACGSNAWGRPTLKIRCGNDGAAMLRTEGAAPAAAPDPADSPDGPPDEPE